MNHNKSGRAPSHLIQADFRDIDSTETLRTTWDNERLILLQSVQGHAHEGHCKFKGKKFPNTSIDDISNALGLNPLLVRSERQNLICEIDCYVDRVLQGDDNAPLSTEDGKGLLGSSMFHGLSVSGSDVLKGLYLGGLRDDPEVRFRMEKKYGITIGGGKCYLVNTRIMDDMKLNGDILAHGSHEDMLDYYKQNGLIVGDTGLDTGDLEYMYIRHRRGQGASDDTAIVAAGLIYGLGVAVGVFLADAIDTLEKHVIDFSDKDGDLATKIKDGYPDLNISDDELLYFAYLSAVPENGDINVPDSSLRHLMAINRYCDTTIIESHLLFVQHKTYPHMNIGYEEISNRKFYDYVSHKVKSAKKQV
ncbi:MAG: hypothetical protein ACYC27_00665 [Armatimonadota bacterium]